LYKAATRAVEDEEAFAEGLSEVKKSQLRAIINTVRMCSRAGTFEHFIEKRKDRREKEARRSDKEHLKKRAEFWNALHDHVGQVLKDYAAPAVEETKVPESKTETAQMRVLRAYFKHFISHCHVADQ